MYYNKLYSYHNPTTTPPTTTTGQLLLASQLRSSMIGQGEPPKGRSQPVRKLRTGGLLPRNIQILVQNTIPVSYVRCDTQDEINPIVEELTGRSTGTRGGTLQQTPGLAFLKARRRIGIIMSVSRGQESLQSCCLRMPAGDYHAGDSDTDDSNRCL